MSENQSTYFPTNFLYYEIGKRVGEHRVKQIQNPLHPDQSILLVFLELLTPVTLVISTRLANYRMPVSDKYAGHEHNELCFVLPSYWDFEDYQNPNFSWIYDWLYRLETYLLEKKTWFGHGHSIAAGNPPSALSETMKQDHFIFLNPMTTSDVLVPFKNNQSEEKTELHFLCIVPIFCDEMDYKMGKSTDKLIRKFIQKGFDERLDDYRKSILATRFKLF
jgi:hypothetical protein